MPRIWRASCWPKPSAASTVVGLICLRRCRISHFLAAGICVRRCWRWGCCGIGLKSWFDSATTDAFASKPAPTFDLWRAQDACLPLIPCGSGLAREWAERTPPLSDPPEGFKPLLQRLLPTQPDIPELLLGQAQKHPARVQTMPEQTPATKAGRRVAQARLTGAVDLPCRQFLTV